MFIKLKKYITDILESIEEYPFFFFCFFQIIFFIWFYKIPLLHNYIYKLITPSEIYKDIITTIASFDGILYSLFFTEFLSKYKEIGQIYSDNKYVMKKIKKIILKFTSLVLFNFIVALFCLHKFDKDLFIDAKYMFILFLNFAFVVTFYYLNFGKMNKMYSTKYLIEGLKENIDEYF